MADRLVRLLRSADIGEKIVMTGGLSKDEGLRAAVVEGIAKDKRVACEVVTHPDAIFAGAMGAALWGAVRHRMLERRRLQQESASAAAPA